NSNKSIILFLTAFALIIMNLKTYFLYIFQSTNRIKEYSQLSRNDRYIYIIGVVIYLVLGGRNFIPLIIWDLISKLIVTIWAFNRLKDLVVRKPLTYKLIKPEIKDNIKIGSNLMISN